MKRSGVSSRKAGWKCRLICFCVAIGCAGFLAVASLLLPRQRGFGTHVQLGLGSCGYLARTGYPCPGCGITTSIAATVHGQFGLALRAQPFGVVIVLGVLAVGVFGLAEFLTGRALLSGIRPRLWWLLPVVGAFLLGWAIKLLTGLATGLYPLGR